MTVIPIDSLASDANLDVAARTSPCGPWRMVAVIAVGVLMGARPAAADRDEALLSVRPLAGIGRFTEEVVGSGHGNMASTYGGGGALEFAYGVRNWLDVGGELVGAGFTEATYDAVVVNVMGVQRAGQLTRTRRVAQLRAGGTLRLGVSWISTLHLGVGFGAAMPTAAALHGSGGAAELRPDSMDATVEIDLALVARIGLERRLDRRWGVGVSVEAIRTAGLGAPPLDVVSVGVNCSYRWYGLFW